MSCNCNKADQVGAEYEFRYSTELSAIQDKRGGIVSLTSSLVIPAYRPSTGWGASFFLNGQLHTFAGQPSAQSVVAEAQSLLELNNSAVSLKTVWLNFNIQWLRRFPPVKCLVDLQTLLQYTTLTGAT